MHHSEIVHRVAEAGLREKNRAARAWRLAGVDTERVAINCCYYKTGIALKE